MDKNTLLGGLTVAFVALLIFAFYGAEDTPQAPADAENTAAQASGTASQAGAATAPAEAASPPPQAARERASATDRVVGCEVTIFGYEALVNSCRFQPLGNGSFRLTSVDGAAIAFPNVAFASDDPASVNVTVTGTGTGTGSAQWSDRSEALGSLTKSTPDGACWEGGAADGPHRICAR